MNIIGRRNTITGEEHRFFLALLLNVPSREKILELVKQRFPETDPVEKILDWVEELGNTRVLGSKEPNALGIEGFDHNGLFVLECLIKGVPISQIHEQAKSTQQLESDELQVTIDRLINSQIFKCMVSPEPKPSA